MDPEKLKALAIKVKEGTSTSEEELALLKFLNQGVGELRTFIKDVMEEKK